MTEDFISVDSRVMKGEMDSNYLCVTEDAKK